jgi:serine/threonine protein kinase
MNNDDNTEFFINPASDPEQVILREKAIELGFLSESQAKAAYEKYQAGRSGINFGSYLLENGLISLEQLTDLGTAAPATVSPYVPDLSDTPMMDEATMLGGTVAPADGPAPMEFDFGDDFGLDETMGGVPIAPAAGAIPAAPNLSIGAAQQSVPPTMGAHVTDENMDGQTMAGGVSFAPGQSIDADNVPGQIVGNIYSGCKITKMLGAGGMGQVFFADRLEDGVVVVVKFLAPEQANNPTWRKRFLREANLQIMLKHPNIVELFSVDGTHNQPHLVMELVTGDELTDALEEVGMFPPKEATRIIRDLADALTLAHKNGVIHRDIKPQNALVTKEGVVKLLDFGLAKNTEMDDGLSLAGQILGTPQYMAPEQWGDHEVDARCDIFSLGATLYHLLTGTMPFQGSKPRQVARKAQQGDYVDPKDLVPDCPEDLIFVIHKMLEPQRRFRYAEMAEVVRDLTAVLEGKPIDIPHFEEKTGKRRGRKCPLIRGQLWKVGRDPGHTIPIPDSSVSRDHATISRGKLGYTLRDLGSSYGSFVGEMRVREVIIKDGDVVKFGKTVFQFADGGLEKLRKAKKTRRIAHVKVDNTLNAMMNGLVEVRDRRVVLHLLEQLPTDKHQNETEGAWQVMRDLLGGEIAGKVVGRLEARLKRRSVMLPSQLFSITRENLGGDVEAWMSWWDNLRDKYPPQITVKSNKIPKARLTVVKGESKPRRIPLEAKSELPIGRDPKIEVPIKNRSVSRLHATLLRYHTRMGLRDEGSRFGTLVNGTTIRVNFLKNGDQIVLGKARLLYEERGDLTLASKGPENVANLAPSLYFCLADLKHSSTAYAQIRFLEMENEMGWIAEEGAKLFPVDDAKRTEFMEKIQKVYKRHAKKAAEILPLIFEGESDHTAAEWRALLEAKRNDMPQQVQPLGWFPDRSV